MFTCCWSAKGGSGVTVTAAAIALAASRASDVALVDLCGDLPTALGAAEPLDIVGVAEWSRGQVAESSSVDRMTVTPTLTLWPRGHGPLGVIDESLLGDLASDVVVDAGCIDDAEDGRALLASHATRSLLVTRACYLSLRRAVQLPLRPHGVVVITEPGRALRASDVASVIGAPVVAEVPFEVSIARAVDAGLLASRCPNPLIRPLVAMR